MKHLALKLLLIALLAVAIVLALAIAAALPAEAQAPPPADIYQLFNYNEPGKPGVIFSTWYQVNPEPGVYNWSIFERALDTIKAPAHIFVSAARSDVWQDSDGIRIYGTDDTPKWVYQNQDRPLLNGQGKVGYVLVSPQGELCPLPAYDDRGTWQPALFAMVAALGRKFDGDPRVGSIIVTTGLDGETQPVKDIYRNWATIMREQAPDVEYRFGKLIYTLMDRYAAAFPNTTLYLNQAPGQGKMEWAKYAEPLGIGLQHSGMWVDLDSHQGYGNFIGSWDALRAYSMTLPIWVESPFGIGDEEHMIWSLYAGLHYHPDAMSTHPEYLALDPFILNWTRVHLGVTIDDTPSVWTVMRDYEFPYKSWGAGGVSGHMGDWTFWLTRLEGGQRVWRDQLPNVPGKDSWQARQCRYDTLMTFDVDPRFERDYYKIIAEVLDTGGEVLLRYRKVNGTWGEILQKTDGTQGWIAVELDAPDLDVSASPDFEIRSGGGVYLHWTGVEGYGGSEPTATPSATPNYTLTPTSTISPTQIVPTYTLTSVPSPTFTQTPTRTPTPSITPTPGLEERVNILKAWAWNEAGVDLRVFVEVGE